MGKTTALSLSWSISKAEETYGYTMARLEDLSTGKKYRCVGGGYDMEGTVFADWLQDVYQKELLQIKNRARSMGFVNDKGVWERFNNDNNLSFYGMLYDKTTEKIKLDGGCGFESMVKIALALNLGLKAQLNKKGHKTGFIVWEKENEAVAS